MVRSAIPGDGAAMADIYNHYILNSTVTFEEERISTEQMQERLAHVQRHHPWLVYEDNGSIVGYAYASSWSSRRSYRRSVESTVYLRKDKTGKGFGTQLYGGLIELVRFAGLHAVIGGIALPNEGSVGLHEKLGFTKVAHFKEVGWKFERWIDVGYWELVL